MSSRLKARRAASVADQELHTHLTVVERALVQALDVAHRAGRERRPEFARMRKNASAIEKELLQIQGLLRRVGMMGEPEEVKPPEATRAEKERESRKKAREESRKTETIARRILAHLEVDSGS